MIAFDQIQNIVFDDVDFLDAPDFCDAYISSAEINGVPLTEEQLEEVNQDRDFVHDALVNYLY